MKASAKAQIQRAFVWHQQGRLDEALGEYEALLKDNPADFDLLHLSGVLLTQKGQLERAGDLLRQALGLRPNHRDARGNFARWCEKAQQWPLALTQLQWLCDLTPSESDIWFRRGSVERKLALNEQAANSFAQALKLRPVFPHACYNLGNTLMDLHDVEGAIDAYQKALKQSPQKSEVQFNLGTAMMKAGRMQQAKDVLEELTAQVPDHYDAFVNLGTVYRELGNTDKARMVYERAISIDAGRVEAPNNFASILADNCEADAALRVLDRALKHAPRSVLLLGSKGSLLKRMGRIHDAIKAYSLAVQISPEDVEIRTSRSLCLLLNGQFAEGFLEYEWRWKSPDLADIVPQYDKPLWLGKESLVGQKILLRWEQGLGDTIQFSRYAAILDRMGAEVILVVQPELLGLMKLVKGRGTLLAHGMPLPEFDGYCPLLSLPLALGTTQETIPSEIPYIHADQEKVKSWRSKLGEGGGPLIGLAWSGRKEHKNDKNRSIPLAELIRHLPKGPRWIILQKDLREGEKDLLQQRQDIAYWGDDLHNFSDTAALCECMDLVVSVDTSVAHLAGAMGKALYLLLPHVPDWRWLMEGESTAWYPNAKLFRQDRSGSWTPVLERITTSLTEKFPTLQDGPSKRVLFVTHDYGANDAAVMLLELSKHWIKNLGWKVDALVDANLSKKYTQELAESGIGQVERITKNNGYDFAVVNTIIDMPFVERIVPMMPVVLWIHESKIVIGNLDVPVSTVWRWFRCSTRIVFQSAWQSEVVYRTFLHDLPIEKICLIPNGLPEFQAPNPVQRVGANHPFEIISVGGLSGRKRQGDLAVAVEVLSKQHAVKCTLVGDTFALTTFSPEVQRLLNSHPAIELTGPLERHEAMQRLSQADLFVSCSEDESQGLSQLEASRLMIPVVLSDLKVYKYFGWINDENCLTYPVGDVDALVRCIEKIRKDKNLAARLSHAAYKLSLEYQARKFCDEFTSLVSNLECEFDESRSYISAE